MQFINPFLRLCPCSLVSPVSPVCRDRVSAGAFSGRCVCGDAEVWSVLPVLCLYICLSVWQCRVCRVPSCTGGKVCIYPASDFKMGYNESWPNIVSRRWRIRLRALSI